MRTTGIPRRVMWVLTIAMLHVGRAAPQDLPELASVRFTLDNGLDVVLAPDSTVNEASVELWVRVGMRDEPAGKFGLAHFYEHATPFGFGVGRTSAGRRLLDSLRTNSNARTRPDYTFYYQQTRAAGLDLFLRVFADRLAADPAAELTAAYAERHRANVAAEIARQAPGVWGWPIGNAVRRGTFGAGHPYGHSGYGSDVETAAITSDDLLRWSRAHFRPELSTLIVVGAMDTTATRLAITRYFGGIPGGERPATVTWAPPIVTAGADTVSVPTTVHRVLLNWPAPAWGSADDPAMRATARILAARFAEGRPSWVAATSADLESWQLAGRMYLIAEVADRRHLARAERWLRDELARLLRDGPAAAELAAAHAAIRADLDEQLARLGWAASRSELIGESVLFGGDLDAWRELWRRTLETGAAQVRDAAGRWLDSPGFALTAIGAGEG